MMDARNADVKMGWPPAIQWCAIRNGQRKFLCNNSMFEFSIFLKGNTLKSMNYECCGLKIIPNLQHI